MRERDGTPSRTIQIQKKGFLPTILLAGAKSMLSEIFKKESLFHILHQIDLGLSQETKKQGCPYCGSRLDQSNYERKPRGGPKNLPAEYSIRQSLCCSKCRHRVLPPSCLFMGRRVYWGGIILVVMGLRQDRPNGMSLGKLKKRFKVPSKTISRWIRYFREEFSESDQWQKLRGKVVSTVKNSELPGALLRQFIQNTNCAQQAIIDCLKFLASGQSGFNQLK
ncbi:MAG: hypothetical protein GY757_05420 [bacterium]|nr:hypothetical protein [bacterium]